MIVAAPGNSYADLDVNQRCCDIKLWGYIDGSYNYLQSSNEFASGVFDRAYDIEENGFTLQQAALSLAYQPEQGLGGLSNVILGRDALATAAYGYNPDIDQQHVGFDVLQAYMQYAISPFTIMAGKYITLVGYEVIESPGNANFSHSLLFTFAEPTTHTGVRGVYAVNDKLKLIVGMNDGWDSIRDWGKGKTIELGMAYTPTSNLSLSAQGYSGTERVVSRTSVGPTGLRNLIDLIASYNVSDQLTIAANYDYGSQENVLSSDASSISTVTWQGLAGYVNYKFNDMWRLAGRAEVFDDTDGYRTGIEQNIKELTLTLGFSPVKNLEIRAETRRDFANVSSFVDKSTGAPRATQQSFALEAIYQFSNECKTQSTPINTIAPSSIAEQTSVAEAPNLPEIHSQPCLQSNPYTLQLLAARSEENVKKFIRQHDLQNSAYIVRTQRKGKEWYVLLYGEYESKAAAKQASKMLPHSLQKAKLKPWIRPLKSMQQES
ncbi:MAG: outer membrane beta-barrel protein [Candidatus Berkiella sp.]